MRHQKAGRKFGRNTSHRRAMFRNMAGNLVLHGQIQTTDAKAKELRRIAERLVTKVLRLGDDLTVDVAKIKDEEERQRILARRLHARRQVARFLPKQLAKTNPDGSKIPPWLSTPFAKLATKGRIGFQGKHGGVPIYFRNIRIMELPPGVTAPEQIAPEL